jgi:hypothetical protein
MNETTVEKPDTKAIDPIWQLAAWLKDDSDRCPLTNGEKAALRRMDPSNVDRRYLVSLYSVLARLEPQSDGYAFGDSLADLITINAIALGNGNHVGATSIGEALAAIEYGALRLNSLLSADLATLAELLPRIAKRLSAQGQSVNWKEFHRLARTAPLPSDDDRHCAVRVSIARNFQRTTQSSKKDA